MGCLIKASGSGSMLNFVRCGVVVFTTLLICVFAQAEPFDESFYPYKDGSPTYPGLEIGMVIDQSNVD